MTRPSRLEAEGGIHQVLNRGTYRRATFGAEKTKVAVLQGFADGMYLNVMPRKPDQPNGTSYIREFPEMSRALMKADRLRKRYIDFFTRGVAIGNSILSENVDVFVSAHVWNTRLLIFVLNDKPLPQPVEIHGNLKLWLPPAESHEVKYYDEGSHLLGTQAVHDGNWTSSTNRFCSFHEHHTAKTITAAGAAWPGLHVWDEMRILDGCAQSPRRRPGRLGCIGLSGGGLRTAMLIAADPRIKAACVTGSWHSLTVDAICRRGSVRTRRVFRVSGAAFSMKFLGGIKGEPNHVELMTISNGKESLC